MARLFANNAKSTLSSSLTNVATSFSVQAGAGARFPSPSGGDYFLVTLENAAATTREIVKVTARSSDTFTIVRAQEGYSGTAFASGDTVDARVTAGHLQRYEQTLADSPDTVPDTPNAADDEFGGYLYSAETSLDTGGTRFSGATAWAWRNQGGATTVLTAGVAVLTAPSGTANLRIIEQALPGGTTWTYRAKICAYAPVGNFWQAGMTVIESGTTKIEQLVTAESGLLRVDRWSNVTTYTTTPGTLNTITWYQRQIYLEIERNGSNVLYRFSPTGFAGTFQLVYTSSGYWTSAPDKIGLVATSNGNGSDVLLSCEWFRRVA